MLGWIGGLPVKLQIFVSYICCRVSFTVLGEEEGLESRR